MSQQKPSPLARLWRLARRSQARLAELASIARALALPPGGRIRARFDGEVSLVGARKVAVFNHFDRRGAVADYVLGYLEALKDAGFAIVFVSTSPSFGEDSLKRVRRHCARIVHRRNVGYDFGAYRDGVFEIPDLDALDALVVANDSVYGPFYELGEILGRCDDSADAWGLTDCWDTQWHLQSYFFLFRPPAIASRAFRHFWRDMLFVRAKSWIIRNYEIGLSRKLLGAGLRLKPLFPYAQARTRYLELIEGLPARTDDGKDHERNQLEFIATLARGGAPLNPTHFFWHVLVFEMGFPFVKRDLLVGNPQGVPYLWRWRELLRARTGYDPDVIDAHLRVLSRNRVT